MTVHKLAPETALEAAPALNARVSLEHPAGSLSSTIIKAQALQALEGGAGRYPIYRLLRCAVRGTLEAVFDDIALGFGGAAARLSEGEILLESPGLFVHASGARKAGYCSCTIRVWAESKSRAEEARTRLFGIVESRRVREPTFVIDWQFSCGTNSLNNASFEEIVSDEVHDEAYPALAEPVMEFVRRYLASDETVLVLLGTPGSGKTRLVRAILGELSRRKGDSAEIMYTCDKKTLETDEMFVSFVTGAHDAFVIEDADHILTPRENGNQDLHRFLAIADGVIRAQGRKIIFTTNLPNMGDLDEALLRPGRCFAAIHTRALTRGEAAKLLGKLCGGDGDRERKALIDAFPEGSKSCSVASVYRAAGALK